MNIQLIVGLVAVAGCAMEPTAEQGPLTLEERLAERSILELQADSAFEVRASSATGEPVALEAPAVAGGQMAMRVDEDGLLVLEELVVELSDFAIVKETGGSDVRLELTDARVRLGSQTIVAAQWEPDGTRVRGVATGDLLLDWALVDRDGDAHPLATQTIRGVELGVDVRLAPDGAIVATLDSIVGGRIWDFGDIEVGDLSVSLSARHDAASPR